MENHPNPFDTLVDIEVSRRLVERWTNAGIRFVWHFGRRITRRIRRARWPFMGTMIALVGVALCLICTPFFHSVIAFVVGMLCLIAGIVMAEESRSSRTIRRLQGRWEIFQKRAFFREGHPYTTMPSPRTIAEAREAMQRDGRLYSEHRDRRELEDIADLAVGIQRRLGPGSGLRVQLEPLIDHEAEQERLAEDEARIASRRSKKVPPSSGSSGS